MLVFIKHSTGTEVYRTEDICRVTDIVETVIQPELLTEKVKKGFTYTMEIYTGGRLITLTSPLYDNREKAEQSRQSMVIKLAKDTADENIISTQIEL